jgi:hypothetical protein
MRWLNSKAFRGHIFSLLHGVLLIWFILCLLGIFNPVLAEDYYDFDVPVLEHPWDDLEHKTPHQNSPGGSIIAERNVFIRFGWSDFWVIIDFYTEREGTLKPTERTSGYILLLSK